MNIGQPLHEHWIEPLELPEPLREHPSIQPEEKPNVALPQEEPVKHGG